MHRPRRRRAAPQAAHARSNGTQPANVGDDWLVGTGTASSLHETAPPTEHISEAWATLGDDDIYEIAVGTVEFGEGTSTVHVQLAATVLGTTPSRVRLVQSDTDRNGFDTGAFASAGMFVAGNAVLRAATALRDRILRFAASHAHSHVSACVMDDDAVRCGDTRVPLSELVAAAQQPRHPVHRVAQGLRVSAQRHVEHARLPRRRAPGDRRDPRPLQRAGHRRRRGDQPGAGARSGGRRCGPGHRLRADRKPPRRRQWRDDQPEPAQLPHPDLRRRPAHRGDPGRLDRLGGADARQGHGRVLHQPGRACAGQRRPRRHRGALPRTAADPGTDLRPSAVGELAKR